MHCTVICHNIAQWFSKFLSVVGTVKERNKFRGTAAELHQFTLIATSITSDSKEGDDLLFFGNYHFLSQHITISDVIDVIDHYSKQQLINFC